MTTCAVCGKENKTLVCSSCGFDGSCDYEKYPSFGRPATGYAPISRRRATLEAKNAAAQAAAAPQKPAPQKPATPTPPPAQKPVTQTPPVSKPSATTPPVKSAAQPAPQPKPPAQKPVTQTPPVSKPATTAPAKPAAQPAPVPAAPTGRSRGFLEKLTILLGWITLGLLAFFALYDAEEFLGSDSLVGTVIFFAIGLLMQRRLLRKGFQPLFGTKIPFGLHLLWYGFLFVDMLVTAFIFPPAMLFGSRLVPFEEMMLLVFGLAMMLYLSFWSLGQLRSRKKN